MAANGIYRGAILLGLLVCVALAAGCAPVRSAPPLAVTLSNAVDQAQVRWEGATPVVTITSPSGIGGATLAWQGEGGPAVTARLRLPLGGLERLQVTNGEQTAALSVGSAPPYTVRAEGDLQGITAERQAGLFTVTLPAAWLQTGRLHVQWIDFYR